MANLRLSALARNEIAETLRRLIDGAPVAGEIAIHSGEQPDGPDDVATGDVLGVLTFSQPAGEVADAGVLNCLSIVEDESARATGEATWARISDGNGNPLFDCDISGEGEGGTIEINTVKIVAGGPIRLRSFSLVVPAG